MRHPAPPRPGARRASCSVSRCPRAAGAGACAGAGAPTWKVLWISSGVKLTYFILADSRLPGPTQLCLGLSTVRRTEGRSPRSFEGRIGSLREILCSSTRAYAPTFEPLQLTHSN